MEAKTAVGKVECFLCAQQCDVFAEASKRKYLYYRCRCGVIQPRTPFGQQQLKLRVKLFEPGTPAANDAVAAVAREAVAEAKQEIRETHQRASGFQTIFDVFGKKQ